ncbi:MAG: DNA-binding response regulator [Bacteroidetes bacterium]|nr:MAG: DNA-binding response regulator [Bacteroidota bacterium]
MIHIAIIDQNKTYRESLKTILEQIEDFRVVHDSPDGKCFNGSDDIPVHILMIDGSMSKGKCSELVQNTLTSSISIKTIVLAMFNEELDYDYGKTEVMLKSSSKREFELRIKKMMANQKEYISQQTLKIE